MALRAILAPSIEFGAVAAEKSENPQPQIQK